MVRVRVPGYRSHIKSFIADGHGDTVGAAGGQQLAAQMKLNPHATEFTWTPAAADFPPLRPTISVSPPNEEADPSSPSEHAPPPSLPSLNGQSPAASSHFDDDLVAAVAEPDRLVHSIDEINALQAAFTDPPESLGDGACIPVKGTSHYDELMDPQRVVSRRSSTTSWKGSPRSTLPLNRNRSIVRRQQQRDPSPMEPIDPAETANSRNAKIVAAADARNKPQKKAAPAAVIKNDETLNWRKKELAGPPISKSWRDRSNPPKRRAQQLYEQAAVAPQLKTSENAWRPVDKAAQDEEQAAEVAIRVLLNKLTPETFSKLSDAAAEIAITGPETLRRLCKTMFDKAIDETSFASLYGQFIVRLQERLSSFKDDDDKTIDVRSEIITRCYQMLTTPPDATAFESLQGAEREEAELIQRRRQIGNVVLMGELFKHGLLVEGVVHVSVGLLLSGPHADIEMLVAFLQTVGKFVERQTPTKMGEYFSKITAQSKHPALAPRLRFMLMDLIDLRRNRWRLRRDKVVDPKMLDEVRKGASSNSGPSSSWTVRPPPKRSVQTMRPAVLRPSTKVTWKSGLTTEPSRNKPFSWGNVPHDIHDDEDEDDDDGNESADNTEQVQDEDAEVVEERDSRKDEQEVEMLVRELYSCLDMEEAIRCAKELPAISHANLVYQAALISFDMKDATRDLCGRFLHQLIIDNVVSSDDLIEGVTTIIQECDDIAIDVPRAPAFLADVLRNLLGWGHLDSESLMGVLQKSESMTCSKLALQTLRRETSDLQHPPQMGDAQ